ncbi:hypothetical protein BKA62DRAFT_739420 [Auriculariales sp. MPI-PUGE-AT-0066]|nr:hypothetical protein BKA62DRAFT_739420 [Auriculariales sp. MPI-PUGE-AT-0066]
MSVSPIVHCPGSVIAVVLSLAPCFAAHLPPSSARSPDLPTCAIFVSYPSLRASASPDCSSRPCARDETRAALSIVT